MGLDVYLYKYENYEQSISREREYETKENELWAAGGGYDFMTDTAKETTRTKLKGIADSLGLNDWGSDETTRKKIEKDSKVDPEHYFKIGYFRSSYNEGGINRVLDNLGIPGLYDIFQPNEQYCFRPDWDSALIKCNEAIELLLTKGNYRVFKVHENIFGSNVPLPTDEKSALEIFTKEVERQSDFAGYENGHGHFYPKEPIQIFALIPGRFDFMGRVLNCVYLIAKGENDWYLNALKIVKETIEYVLAQPDKEKYYLHWSS